jgi:hypothetical protein
MRLFIVNLRGRRNPLGHPDDRASLAAMLRTHEIETLLVDPFGRAYTGQSQNDPGEVGAWLADLDRFTRSDVGAKDLVLSAHAGWDGERTRGASALEDWADSIVTLVKGKDDDEASRYLRATGRDVDLEEDRLDFNPRTRTLTLSGAGSRRKVTADRKVESLVPEIIALVTRKPGMNGTAIETALRDKGVSFQKGAERKALQNAVQLGWLRIEAKGTAKCYFPGSTSPEASPQTSPLSEPPELLDLPVPPQTSPGSPPDNLPASSLEERGVGEVPTGSRADLEHLGAALREQHIGEDE